MAALYHHGGLPGLTVRARCDKFGREVPFREWVRLLCEPEYSRIATTSAGTLLVSTVWLGFDFNWGRFLEGHDGRPVLYETRIYVQTGEVWSSNRKDHELAGQQWRWHTYEDAVAGHGKVVEHLQTLMTDDDADEEVYHYRNQSAGLPVMPEAAHHLLILRNGKWKVLGPRGWLIALWSWLLLGFLAGFSLALILSWEDTDAMRRYVDSEVTRLNKMAADAQTTCREEAARCDALREKMEQVAGQLTLPARR